MGTSGPTREFLDKVCVKQKLVLTLEWTNKERTEQLFVT